MKDFPILTKKVISDNEILFEFDCGDLWYRKNADKSEDIDKSIDLFKKELPALKGKKFEKLNLSYKQVFNKELYFELDNENDYLEFLKNKPRWYKKISD